MLPLLWLEYDKYINMSTLNIMMPEVILAGSESPGQYHQGVSVIRARAQLGYISVQHRQADLEDWSDPAVEEAVEDTQSAAEREHAHEQSQEPREGRRRQRGEVRDVVSQLRQPFTNQLLKHRLIHLSSWARGSDITEDREEPNQHRPKHTPSFCMLGFRIFTLF